MVVPLVPLPGQPSTPAGGGLFVLTSPVSGSQNFQGNFTAAQFEGPLQGKQMGDLLALIKVGGWVRGWSDLSVGGW